MPVLLPDNYSLSTNREDMQVERIHRWLTDKSYWAKGIPYGTVKITVDNSAVVGAFHNGAQIGFARFVTDYAVFAYLADVYVEEPHRGIGVSKKMMEVLMAQPWIAGLRRLLLATQDAHTLYEQFGFSPLGRPDRMMEIQHLDVYRSHPPDSEPVSR